MGTLTPYLDLYIPEENEKGFAVSKTFRPNFTKLDQNAELVNENKLTKINTAISLGNTDFQLGTFIEVLGYYNIFDGATHNRKKENTDDGSGIQDKDGNWWNIVHNGEVNVSWFGAKGDGVTDDTTLIVKAINMANKINFNNSTYAVTSTISLYRRKSLNFNQTTFKYVGTKTDCVLNLGGNAVGETPTRDCSEIFFYGDLKIDCNNLADFGVYGTYITNQSKIQNITSVNSLECGIFICKAWFAEFKNLRSITNNNHGIVLGAPFKKTDGSIFEIQGGNQYEINNCPVINIRSHSHNLGGFTDLQRGIGILIGEGHSLNLQFVQAERGRGGVGICIKRITTYDCTVSNFYVEDNAVSILTDWSTNIDTTGIRFANGMVTTKIKSVGTKPALVELKNVNGANNNVAIEEEKPTFLLRECSRLGKITNSYRGSRVSVQRELINMRYYYKKFFPKTGILNNYSLVLWSETNLSNLGSIAFLDDNDTVITSYNIPDLRSNIPIVFDNLLPSITKVSQGGNWEALDKNVHLEICVETGNVITGVF